MDEVDARLRVLWLIWFAFLNAIFVYGLVTFVLANPETAPVDGPNLLRIVLAGGAVAAGLASFGVRQFFSRELREAPPLPAPHPSVASPKLNVLLQRLTAGCIVTWAFCEVVGIFGVVLSILSQRFEEVFPFAAAAGILLFWHRPSMWPLERIRAVAGKPL